MCALLVTLFWVYDQVSLLLGISPHISWFYCGLVPMKVKHTRLKNSRKWISESIGLGEFGEKFAWEKMVVMYDSLFPIALFLMFGFFWSSAASCFYKHSSVAGSGIAFGNVMRSISSDFSDLPFTFGDESTGLSDFVVVSCAVVKGDSVLESIWVFTNGDMRILELLSRIQARGIVCFWPTMLEKYCIASILDGLANWMSHFRVNGIILSR